MNILEWINSQRHNDKNNIQSLASKFFLESYTTSSCLLKSWSSLIVEAISNFWITESYFSYLHFFKSCNDPCFIVWNMKCIYLWSPYVHQIKTKFVASCLMDVYKNSLHNNCKKVYISQPAIAFSKLTIETLEQGAKYVQRYNKDNRTSMVSFWCLFC